MTYVPIPCTLNQTGTEQRWKEINPILCLGEIGVISGTDLFKIGDGVTPWNELSYSTGVLVKDADGNLVKVQTIAIEGVKITTGLDGTATFKVSSNFSQLDTPTITSNVSTVPVNVPVTFTLSNIPTGATSVTWDIPGNPTIVDGSLTGTLIESITIQWINVGSYNIRAKFIGDNSNILNSDWSNAYSMNVTPPLVIADNDDYTVLLIHSDELNNSKIITDKSKSGRNGLQHPIINNNVIHTDVHPTRESSTSMYFNNSYLMVPTHQDFTFDNDFTIDCSFNVHTWKTYMCLFSTRCTMNKTGGFIVYLSHESSGSKIIVYYQLVDGSFGTISTNTMIATNQDYHFEISRHGSQINLFLDGQIIGSITDSRTIVNNGVVIGTDFFDYGTNYFNGYVNEFRISKGVCRHTSAFTQPTKKYIPDYIKPINDDSTILLLTSNTTDGSTIFTDTSKMGNSGSKHTITSNGLVKHTNDFQIFNNSSIYFSNGAYLTIPGTDFNFTSSDWCMEVIYSPNFDITTEGVSIFCSDDLTVLIGYNHGYYPGKLFANINGTVTVSNNVNLIRNSYNYIAYTYCHEMQRISFFLNGILVGTQQLTIQPNITILRIAYSACTGYIDNLRISKGHPRYLCDYHIKDEQFNFNY